MKKLKGNKGETLAETLVAMLLTVLALVMLAGAITATANIVIRSREWRTAYGAKNNVLEQYTTSSGTGNVSLEGMLDNVEVDFYINDTYDKRPVVAYRAYK